MSCAGIAAEQIDPMHAAECLACRRALVEQRALVAQLARLPAPSLGRERRQTLAAEVMARADLQDAPMPRRRTGRYVAAVLAAAALVAVLVREDGGLSARMERRAIAVVPPAAPGEPVTHVPDAPAVVPPRTEPRVVVEAPSPEPQVTPTPRVSNPSRRVFGGTSDRRGSAIERDLLVEQTPTQAFRAGWEALREARYADAIAAFDRATDPAVAEDAAFWAAIAAQRAGQADDARKRLDLFLATFPESPRAESARRAREVLR